MTAVYTAPRPLTPAMRTMLVVALWALAAIVLAATASAFAESYYGLREWALNHRVPAGWRANAWPLQVDAYILAGEIVLLVGAIRSWGLRARLLGWTLTGSGLAASVVWNAGHVGADATSADHITAAVPPVAAVAGLMAGLAVIKRLAADPVMTPALTTNVHPVTDPGSVTLRPATPAARTAILTALTADLAAAVGEVGRAVVEIDRLTPGPTSGPRDVKTSEPGSSGQNRPDASSETVTLDKKPSSSRGHTRRPDVQTSTPNDSARTSIGPGKVAPDQHTTRDPDRAARLAALPSDAARVRAVLDAFGLDTKPAEVARFLSLYGYEMDHEAIRSAIRRARKAAQSNSGPVLAGALGGR